MTAAAPYSTFAALDFANRQTVCYTDPWGYRGHKFPREATETDRCFCGETTQGEYARAGARLWNGGVLRSTMARWLFDVAQVTVWTLGRDAQSGYDPVIRRLASDSDADESSLAWCATKERAASCRAGLIIGPWDADTDHPASAIATSNNPKLTFAELAAHFFPAPRAQWPGTDSIIGSRTPLAPGVVLGPDVVLGNDVIIGPNTVIANATIGHGARIGANCTIGLDGFGFVKGTDGEWLRFPQRGRVVIGDRVEIGSNTCIDRGALSDTVIEAGAKIDNLVHIAHNVRVGARAMIIANVTLCGGSIIEPDAWVAPSATVREQRTIGTQAVVGLGAVVVKDVGRETTVKGNPAR